MRTIKLLLLLLLHPFSGLFSSTTWVSQYQKGKTSLDLNEPRDDGVLGWQWHQLDQDHMQTICISVQTNNHTNTPSVNFYSPYALLTTVHLYNVLKTTNKYVGLQTVSPKFMQPACRTAKTAINRYLLWACA